MTLVQTLACQVSEVMPFWYGTNDLILQLTRLKSPNSGQWQTWDLSVVLLYCASSCSVFIFQVHFSTVD